MVSRDGLLVRGGAGSWYVQEPGPCRRCRRSPGDRTVDAGPGGAGRRAGPRWQACRDARLADRPRRRAVGAGARYRLVFLDRLLATLVQLRHGVTHDVLACWFGVARSSITRAVGEIHPLLAERGCTVEGWIRLRTGADVIAHLG